MPFLVLHHWALHVGSQRDPVLQVELAPHEGLEIRLDVELHHDHPTPGTCNLEQVVPLVVGSVLYPEAYQHII